MYNFLRELDLYFFRSPLLLYAKLIGSIYLSAVFILFTQLIF